MMQDRGFPWVNSKKDVKFEINLGSQAAKYIEKLELKMRTRVLTLLEQIANNPFEGDIETIKGRPGYYRRRIGRYRLKFFIAMDKREVRIISFGPKGDFEY